jgi:peptidoglycan/LPS O-acetylase OafA/YrhL
VNRLNQYDIRRTLGWALVVALCVAALTAIVAVLDGDFNDTDWRIIGMSLGFGVFCALGASGATLRLREQPGLRHLGLATLALSLVGFVLLVVALWTDEGEGEGPWELWGCVSLAALAASHASLVLGARRDSDSDGIRLLSNVSVVLGTIDASIGILAIAGAVEEVGDGSAQVVAVLVILLILTTALPPILRRLGGPAERPAPQPLSVELLATADRIEALNGDPSIRRECERLRQLAREHAG